MEIGTIARMTFLTWKKLNDWRWSYLRRRRTSYDVLRPHNDLHGELLDADGDRLEYDVVDDDNDGDNGNDDHGHPYVQDFHDGHQLLLDDGPRKFAQHLINDSQCWHFEVGCK